MLVRDGNIVIHDGDCTLQVGLTEAVAGVRKAGMIATVVALVSCARDDNPRLSKIIDESGITACIDDPHQSGREVSRKASKELEQIQFVADSPQIEDAGNGFVKITYMRRTCRFWCCWPDSFVHHQGG